MKIFCIYLYANSPLLMAEYAVSAVELIFLPVCASVELTKKVSLFMNKNVGVKKPIFRRCLIQNFELFSDTKKCHVHLLHLLVIVLLS